MKRFIFGVSSVLSPTVFMRHLLLVLTLFGGLPSLRAQSLTGTAIYRVVEERNIRQVKEALSDLLGNISGWQQNFHHEYDLVFSPVRAYYHPRRALKPRVGRQSPYRIVIQSSTPQQEVFQDRQTGRMTMIVESGDRTFYITDSLLRFRWRLRPQKRKVGDFVVFKAEGMVWRVRRPPVDSGLCRIDTARVVAWYAPQISVSFGPSIYGGLPGLILELQDDKYHYYLQKVTLEKQREPVKKAPSPPSDAMRWAEWLRYRRDRCNDDPRRKRAAKKH